jgi:glucan endo-1,3-beta-D-glucosidase
MKSSILAALGGASTALAAVRGFNYAAQGQSADSFVAQFKTAASLEGADDFTSARLYTMIQEGTTNSPIDAIQAAIETKTTLLLGLWTSVGQAAFDNEITALKNAIQQYGSAFTDLVVGISVGSEDLYRVSPTGIAANSGVGQTPDVLVDYIGQTRDAIKGTSLASKPVGHVDTWADFVNSTNSEVVAACDFLGLDEYPYYQTTDVNTVDNGSFLFFQAYDRVKAVAGGKPVWITEAGWPVSGPESNLAVASVENAETFWQDVACELISRGINTWWYILADAGSSPSFGVSSNGQPLYDLSCKADSGSNSTSTASSSSSTARNSTASTASGSSVPSSKTATVTGSGSGASATATGIAGSPDAATSGNTASAPAASGGGATQTAQNSASGTSSGSSAVYTGAATKTEGSIVALVIAGIAAAYAL